MSLPGWGMHKGVDYDTYSAWPAIRSSDLNAFAKTAAHAHWAMTHPSDAAHFKLGNAVHCAILEPERFASTYAVAPKLDLRTKAGKAAWEACQADNEGRIILRAEEWEQAEAMRKAVWSHKLAAEILSSPGVRECSFLWQDAKTKRACKARVDLLCNWNDPSVGRPVATVLDLKTSRDATPRLFASDAAKHGYHVSAAWYLRGLREISPSARQFVHLVVEKEPPHICALYRMDEEFLDAGAKLADEYKRRLINAEESGVWPGYEDVSTLYAPPWVGGDESGGGGDW